MAVYDLTDNPMADLAIGRTIGGGIGSGLANRRDYADKQQKEYEKLYLESANERLIQVLSWGSTEGKSAPEIHAEVMNIHNWSLTDAGKRYGDRLHTEYMRANRKGATGQSEPLTRMKSLIDMRNTYTEGKLGTTGWDEANDPTLKWIDLEMSNIRNAGQVSGGGVPTPGGEGQNLGMNNEVHFQSPEEKTGSPITGTYGKEVVESKVDKDIEVELSPTESYPNPNRSVRTAVDAMTPEEQKDQLSKARKALEEGNLPRPKTKAEHDALQPGDQYLDPDGNVRTKGKTTKYHTSSKPAKEAAKKVPVLPKYNKQVANTILQYFGGRDKVPDHLKPLLDPKYTKPKWRTSDYISLE